MKTETTAELWHLCRPEVSRKEYDFVSYGIEKQSKDITGCYSCSVDSIPRLVSTY